MSVRLPDHLDLIATAPGGIQKLRGLILELAVRGKLVAQDPNDEPASELLKRIAQERARLEAERVCRKSKATPLVGTDEQSFALPFGWEWVRVANLGETQTGTTPSKSQPSLFGSDFPFIKPGDISDRSINYENEGLSSEGVVNSGRLARAGSVLMVCIGTIGKCGVIDRSCSFNQQINSISPAAGTSPFVFMAMRSNYFQSEAWSRSSSTTIAILNKGNWEAIPLPLPPLAEQHRIVAKVDELMVLCDQLEAEQADSASAHARLVDTLLATLTQSTDAADLATNWQRLAEHFDTLFTTTEPSLDVLKQTILQLAVMGKLVPQNLNDEPASELLKRIAKERAQLEADGVCKKSKPLPPVGDDEQQHSIPRTWKYVRLQEICSTITDGTHQTPKYTESGRPFLSAQNVKPFRFMPQFFRYVSEKDYQGYVKSSKPEFGDILLTRVGAMIGEAAVIDKQMDFAIYVSLALLKPCQPFVLPEFITLWLNSPFGTHSSIRDTLGRGVSAGNLNLSMIRAFAVPLPPISEQKRIVGKVGELMLLCDRLKIDFVAARQHQATLADSLIDSALEAT